MKTTDEEYGDYLEKKYLPGRLFYLNTFFYPKIFRLFQPGDFVDLGCGTGDFLRFLRRKKIPCIGIDSNHKLVEKCNSMGFEVYEDDIVVMDSIKVPIKNALCDNVLEHLTTGSIDQFFFRMKMKSQPGAILVIVVPDKKGFASDPTHVTFVTKDMILKLCDTFGCRLNAFFFHPLNFSVMGKICYLNMQAFSIIM